MKNKKLKIKFMYSFLEMLMMSLKCYKKLFKIEF